MDYAYLWADGIHVNIRLEEHNLCLQVMIGVCADGRKELIAPRGWLPRVHEVVGGHAARLRLPWHARPGAGCRGRGAGVLERPAGGVPPGRAADGSTRPPTCWLRCRSPCTRARRRASQRSGHRGQGPRLEAAKVFAAAYSAKFPRQLRRSLTTLDELLAFCDYPCKH